MLPSRLLLLIGVPVAVGIAAVVGLLLTVFGRQAIQAIVSQVGLLPVSNETHADT